MRRQILALACVWLLAGRSPAQEPENSLPRAPPSAGLAPLAPLEPADTPPPQRRFFFGAGQAGEGGSESDSDSLVETERDSFTPQTRTVDRGRFILESAYSFIDNRGTLPTHSVPEMLLRYGVAERIELRLGWNFEAGGASNDISGQDAEDIFQGRRIKRDEILSYGIKATLTDQKRLLPESAVIFQGLTPTGGQSTATQMVATYVFGWKLPNGWKSDAAIRYGTETENGERFSEWVPSAVLSIPLGERWGVHAEYFGLFSQDRQPSFARHYFSPGIHYLLTRNLELGLRLGVGLNDQSVRFFSNVGLAGASDRLPALERLAQ
jgi:hypothetical protein